MQVEINQRGTFFDSPRSWTVTHYDRPWTLNSERAGGARGVGGRIAASKLTKEWRETFMLLAFAEKIPHLERITLEVIQGCKNKVMPDPVSIFPAYKAALDGLVDAGVVDDDDGRYVKAVLFQAPYVAGKDFLRLVVREVSSLTVEEE